LQPEVPVLDADDAAWQSQKDSARRRGIAFCFTFEEWRAWWRQNLPPDAARGRRRGQYVMARRGDQGAYEASNVVCVTTKQNAAMIASTVRQAAVARVLRRPGVLRRGCDTADRLGRISLFEVTVTLAATRS
jgi:hypothetical protein